MTRKEYVQQQAAKLDTIDGQEPDGDHSQADDILLASLEGLGAGEIADAYRRLTDRARWWATA